MTADIQTTAKARREGDITGHTHDPVRYGLSWALWPGLFAICCMITVFGMRQDQLLLYFNFAYLFLIVSLLWLERFMPHEESWRRADGQFRADILHTLSSKGTVQGILLFGGVIGLAELIPPADQPGPGYAIWPREWPLFAQVILGVVAAEFGLYWAHRLGHEWPLMWRFHAVHHSVRKLWIVNTGRFHFIDSLISIVMGLAVLLALGAPMEVVQWLSAVTAFIGMLTHCNVEMRFGWLSYVFNTPGLHRWHHSKKLYEGNTNYGENVMIWDQVFGSFFCDTSRRPPRNVGITTYMPPRFSQQLLWPFMTKAQKARIEAEFEGL